jgi:hypothetical protein
MILVSCVASFVNCFRNGCHVHSSNTSLVTAMELALKKLSRAACWKPKATDTYSEYVILVAFPLNNGCTNASQCYVVGALPVLGFFFAFL